MMNKQEFWKELKLRQDRLTEAYFSGVEAPINRSIFAPDGGFWGSTKQKLLKHDKYGVIPYKNWENVEDGFLEKPSMEGLMYRLDRYEYPNIKNRKTRVYRVEITDITDSSDDEDKKWVEAAQSSYERDVKLLGKKKYKQMRNKHRKELKKGMN